MRLLDPEDYGFMFALLCAWLLVLFLSACAAGYGLRLGLGGLVHVDASTTLQNMTIDASGAKGPAMVVRSAEGER